MRGGEGREKRKTFTRPGDREQSERRNEASSPVTPGEFWRRPTLIHKAGWKIWSAAAGEKRISSIIQSHPSNDRQIGGPWLILQPNKLLKDETAVYLLGLISVETIANLQQSAGIRSPSAAGAACRTYRDWETEFGGQTTQRTGAAPQQRLGLIITCEAVT